MRSSAAQLCLHCVSVAEGLTFTGSAGPRQLPDGWNRVRERARPYLLRGSIRRWFVGNRMCTYRRCTPHTHSTGPLLRGICAYSLASSRRDSLDSLPESPFHTPNTYTHQPTRIPRSHNTTSPRSYSSCRHQEDVATMEYGSPASKLTLKTLKMGGSLLAHAQVTPNSNTLPGHPSPLALATHACWPGWW